MEAGGELTVKLCCQEPCVMFPHQVSAASVKYENMSAQLCCWVSVTHSVWCENPQFSAFFLLFLTGNKPFISYEVVCPSTWVKFGHGCYNFEPVVQRLTFEEAREHCRQKGRV